LSSAPINRGFQRNLSPKLSTPGHMFISAYHLTLSDISVRHSGEKSGLRVIPDTFPSFGKQTTLNI